MESISSIGDMAWPSAAGSGGRSIPKAKGFGLTIDVRGAPNLRFAHLLGPAGHRILRCACGKTNRPGYGIPGMIAGIGSIVLSGLAAIAADDPAILAQEFVYQKAPFPSCHAATLAETPRGLAAAWFGGSREGADDVGIWFSSRTGNRWSSPVEVANGVVDNRRYPCWNPVLFQAPDGPLLLFFKVGPSPSRWWGMLKTSRDGGESWSEALRLPEGILGPIKNKPVLLANNRLLCPTSTEQDGWKVHFEWSSDLGKTWSKSESLGDGKSVGIIQPSILIHPDRRLQMLCRSQQKAIYQAWSMDQGQTWSEPIASSLPNPNSGIDAVTLEDGRFLLVYNHTSAGRSPLNLAISRDGSAWQAGPVLENQPGEYSYPAIIQTADGIVHLVYTHQRTRIKHVAVDPSKIEPTPLPAPR
ncbi:MAG: sialidase family protein [Isosphaeraceae bacterium]